MSSSNEDEENSLGVPVQVDQPDGSWEFSIESPSVLESQAHGTATATTATAAHAEETPPNQDHHTERKDNQERNMVNPSEKDVISGLGSALRGHLGNVRFRDILKRYRPLYNRAEKRQEKQNVVAHAIAEIKEGGVRFLKATNITSSYMKHKCEELVDADEVKEKVRHFLREKKTASTRGEVSNEDEEKDWVDTLLDHFVTGPGPSSRGLNADHGLDESAESGFLDRDTHQAEQEEGDTLGEREAERLSVEEGTEVGICEPPDSQSVVHRSDKRVSIPRSVEANRETGAGHSSDSDGHRASQDV